MRADGRHGYLIVPWFATLFVLACFAIGGVCLIRAAREQERVTLDITARLAHVDGQLLIVADSARRAHLRADTLQRKLDAITAQLGWADDHAHTKLLTIPLEQRLALGKGSPPAPAVALSEAVTVRPPPEMAPAFEKTLLDLRPAR